MSGKEIWVTIGPSGSGKTYWANNFFLGKVFDSDDMRLKLFGDSEFQGNNGKVFDRLYEEIYNFILKGEGERACLCATNLSHKYRRHFISNCKKRIPGVKVNCILFAAPLPTLLENMENRDRKVEEKFVRRQISQFQIPFWKEGWDAIYVTAPYGYVPSNWMMRIERDVELFGSQENPHHSLSLKDHLLLTSKLSGQFSTQLSVEDVKTLEIAGSWHDVGKVFTKTYDSAKIAHYYGHENWSAYYALVCGLPYEVAVLCGYHMIPYDKNGISTWRARLGENLWEKIMILHRADEEAH